MTFKVYSGLLKAITMYALYRKSAFHCDLLSFIFVVRFNEGVKGECVSIFLRAIVLQTYSPTEFINSLTCCFESPNRLFQRFLVLQTVGRTTDKVVNTIVSQVLLFEGLSIHKSRPVCHQSYFLGLLIRQSKGCRNDGTTATTIPIEYSNEFFPITSCLAFLSTIST